ncbi:methyl-accepting chemotaxis protein [Litoribacillus peritrichatus]|uniref:Methyl-accepting chemotaxis protein n=1 Tax=Litoribacillus peritrichatus TaxID=718191 RepID=A0ABP7MDT6_9GAMM
MSERLLGQQLPASLASVSQSIKAHIAAPMSSAKLIAENYFINDWINNNEDPGLLDNFKKYFTQIKQSTNAGVVFFVSNQTNNYYTENGIIKQVSSSNSNDQWFYGFLNSGKKVDLSLDYFEGTGPLTLFLNYRVAGGKGAAGLGLNVDDLSDSIRAFKLEKTGYVLLANSKGKIIIHPNQSNIGQQISKLPVFDGLSDSIISGNSYSTFQNTADGLDYLLASEYLPELDYYLIGIIPESELYESLNNSVVTTLFITVFIIVVSLIIIAVLIIRTIKPLGITAALLEDIGSGEGDLTKRIRSDSNDEIGRVAKGFNEFVTKLQDIIMQVAQRSNGVLSLSEDVHQQANFSQLQTDEQRRSIESLATAMAEMGSTIQEIAQNANNAADIARNATDRVESGNVIVKESISQIQSLSDDMSNAAQVIHELSQQSESIGSILNTIRGISEQTNLLALNAAIEAARAGEQGRGFAVVADEVRSLAQKTAESTDEIQKMIEQLQSGSRKAVDVINRGQESTNKTVDSVNEAGIALTEIRTAVDQINDMNFQVATATEEQSQAIEEMNSNVITIEDVSGQNYEVSEQVTQLATQLTEFANELSELVSQFKV